MAKNQSTNIVDITTEGTAEPPETIPHKPVDLPPVLFLLDRVLRESTTKLSNTIFKDNTCILCDTIFKGNTSLTNHIPLKHEPVMYSM